MSQGIVEDFREAVEALRMASALKARYGVGKVDKRNLRAAYFKRAMETA